MSENCLFCKIAAGELDTELLAQTERSVAFRDINPQAPVHVLVIPKRPYISLADFTAGAGDAEIAGFLRAVGTVGRLLGLEASGYRVLSNMGEHGGQEVPHFHVHLFGGRPLGVMLAR